MEQCSAARGTDSAAGFSLLEIVVALTIMSILAGSGAALALRSVRGNLQDRTLNRMKELMTAMIGNPDRGTFGYLGDMGRLPDSSGGGLTLLAQRGTQTASVASSLDGVISGWNGPYVLSTRPADVPVDAWNSPLLYTGTAQLTSRGPDRQTGTTASDLDNIVYPAVVPITTGQISVLVKGQLNEGGPPIALRADEASVRVYYTVTTNGGTSSGGVATRTELTPTYAGAAGSGIWNTTALHLGEHGILVTGLNGTSGGGRNYTGSISRDVVRLSRGTAFVTVLLDEAG
jgi:prepilin-type N-terminal cleavage/methylation domain-containing protein